jgi:hypothetical protein
MPSEAIKAAIRHNKAKLQRNKCWWCLMPFHQHFRPARISHLAGYPKRRDHWDSRNLVAACPKCAVAHRRGILSIEPLMDAFRPAGIFQEVDKR